jgi:hypothetical protein
MKSTTDMTPEQIRTAAHEAIAKELGVVGLIRFLQMNSLGSGNYTLNRTEWLPRYATVAEMLQDFGKVTQRMRDAGELPPPSPPRES